MNFLQRFFYGRNGSDPLNITLLVLAVIFSLISNVLLPSLFYTLSYAALLLCLFRMLSRNLGKRQQENALFMEKTQGIRSFFTRNSGGYSKASGSYSTATHRTRVKKDRANYRYFKCPNCKQPLRVPRGKGNIKIKCSNCSMEFIKKV